MEKVKREKDDRRGVYRNWRAVDAKSRTSAGPMKNKKKEAKRKACRGKVNENS